MGFAPRMVVKTWKLSSKTMTEKKREENNTLSSSLVDTPNPIWNNVVMRELKLASATLKWLGLKAALCTPISMALKAILKDANMTFERTQAHWRRHDLTILQKPKEDFQEIQQIEFIHQFRHWLNG